MWQSTKMYNYIIDKGTVYNSLVNTREEIVEEYLLRISKRLQRLFEIISTSYK